MAQPMELITGVTERTGIPAWAVLGMLAGTALVVNYVYKDTVLTIEPPTMTSKMEDYALQLARVEGKLGKIDAKVGSLSTNMPTPTISVTAFSGFPTWTSYFCFVLPLVVIALIIAFAIIHHKPPVANANATIHCCCCRPDHDHGYGHHHNPSSHQERAPGPTEHSSHSNRTLTQDVQAVDELTTGADQEHVALADHTDTLHDMPAPQYGNTVEVESHLPSEPVNEQHTPTESTVPASVVAPSPQILRDDDKTDVVTSETTEQPASPTAEPSHSSTLTLPLSIKAQTAEEFDQLRNDDTFVPAAPDAAAQDQPASDNGGMRGSRYAHSDPLPSLDPPTQPRNFGNNRGRGGRRGGRW